MKRYLSIFRGFIFFGIILINPIFLSGQSQKNAQELRNFIVNKRSQMRQQKTDADSLAKILGFSIRKQMPSGELIELMRFRDKIPIYYITNNYDAAVSTQVDKLWSTSGLGYNLYGSGYDKLAEWDGGGVLLTHQEFNAGAGSRVTQVDGPISSNYHSTHVAGTMIAEGEIAQSIGMASGADLLAYEWTDDTAEMADAALNYNIELSNHSYGSITGWYYNFRGDGLWCWFADITVSTTEEHRFGFYDSESSDWDQIAYDYPNYLIVKSAGNDRDDDIDTPGDRHWYLDGGSWKSSRDVRDPDGQYDCIGTKGVAKNVLTVGAVADVTQFDDPSFITMSSFSSWGPADDGRIKPDIVANGVGLYSTFNDSDDAYYSIGGTSMSSPNATGSMVLLQEHYQNLHGGTPMRSATLKALVIHTAVEAGDYPGPDYQFGWGLLNAYEAAKKITEDEDQDVVAELQLFDGGTFQRTVTASGTQPLIVTLVWTDPPGNPVSPSVDPSDPMLVNDLDLRITKDSDTYYAWKLDRNNPANAATNSGENNIDNVEQVYIESPVESSYTITVDHDGALSSSQYFSLIISGINEYSTVPECSPDLVTPADDAANVRLTTTIEWYPADRATSYDLYFGTDTPPTNIVNGDNQVSTTYGPSLASNTAYYIRVVPRNDQGTATGCPIWSFSTGSNSMISDFPFSEDFETFGEPDGIGIGNDWVNSSDDAIDWVVNSGSTLTSGTGPTVDHTLGNSSGKYLYIEASAPNYPMKRTDLLTPLFDLSLENNPTLEFWYHMYDNTNLNMGDLSIDVYGNGYWNYDVFKKSGNQGDNWWVVTVDLSPYKSGSVHQIRFRGVTGSNWISDIAIDDVIIKSDAFHTFMAGDLAAHIFPNTGVTIQFTTVNSADVTVTAIKNDYNPGVFGDFPVGVENISAERFWSVTEDAGTANGNYNIALELLGLSGISEYSTLELLKRPNTASEWVLEGTNAYVGTGTEVLWTGISSGFSEFGIGGQGDNSLPVELFSFDAQIESGNIILTWITKSEIENLGFILERKNEAQGSWIEIDSYASNETLRGQGNYSSEFQYQFRDDETEFGKTHYYRLSDVSYSGQIFRRDSIEITVTAGEDISQIPTEYILKNAFPNPFNPATNIMFGLPENAQVKIVIYNIVGQKVRTLTDKNYSPGWHILQWDGKSDAKNFLGSGQYFYSIQTKHYSAFKKMLLVK